MSASRSSEPRGAQLPAQPHALSVRAVVFDVGETLIDETTEYGTWADWLGIPRHTFSAMFGAVIARGEDYRQTFQHFRPGFDLAVERLRREQASFPEHFDEGDLYPDARPCLEKLKQLGFLVGIAGNQTARAEALLRELQLPVDFIGTSGGWGAEKPSPAFFARIVTESGCAANEIAYVGDRLDNDIRPALAAGMIAVLIQRGPWGYIHAAHPDVARADICIESLDELPERLTIKPSA
jgi:HAD superfamily hydrolase (TIGR01549 family)